MKETKTIRKVKSPSGEIEYTLIRKSVKNLNLRIKEDGSVTVSVPARTAMKYADEFVVNKGDFIIKAIEKFKKRDKMLPKPREYKTGELIPLFDEKLPLIIINGKNAGVLRVGNELIMTVTEDSDREKLLDEFYKAECAETFSRILNELYPYFEERSIPKPLVKIRKMRSRWGSCLTSKGVITLNLRLSEAPVKAAEYVILHELCHLVVPDHSKRFHDLVSSLMPDWKDRKKLLNESVRL